MNPGGSAWPALLRSQAARCFLLIWLSAFFIGLTLAIQPAHPLADVSHYKYWTRMVTLGGVAMSYSGAYPESYTIYPPVTMYGLYLVGQLYRMVEEPSFGLETALESQWLTVGIRLLALSFHLLGGGVLFLLLGRWAGAWRGTVGAGLYLLNPGALWAVAVWAQPDALHSLFALLGTWLIGRSAPLAGGAWFGLAAMTKPQAWVLLPLAGLAALRQSGPRGALNAAFGGALIAFTVLLPFVLGGRLSEVMTLPGRISSVMPVASANAHNLWWIVTGGAFPFVFDNEQLTGGLALTFRQAALLLLLPVLAFSMRRAWFARGPWELATLSAYWVQAWFSLTTAAHENHQFLIFPFLCLVWWRSVFLMVILALLTVTFSFNVLVHDFGLAPYFDDALGTWGLRLQMLASGLNLSILAAWTVWLARGRSTGDEAGEGNKP